MYLLIVFLCRITAYAFRSYNTIGGKLSAILLQKYPDPLFNFTITFRIIATLPAISPSFLIIYMFSSIKRHTSLSPTPTIPKFDAISSSPLIDQS